MHKPIIINDEKLLNPIIYGLEPVVNNGTKFLILGTFPAKESIEADYYYQNQETRFWGQALSSISPGLNYIENRIRNEILLEKKIGLWDIFECIQRIDGNQDKDIEKAKYNDFASFLGEFSSIQYLIFNGKTNTYNWFIEDNPHIYKRQNLILKPLQSSSGGNGHFNFGEDWKLFFKKFHF